MPGAGPTVRKAPTGIQGFDEITYGGLPLGRPTVVCGGPGSAKSLFAMQILVNGARAGEPGVFVSFEERPEDIRANFASLHFGLDELIGAGRLQIVHVEVDPHDFQVSGSFDLEGLFVRLDHALKTTGARRLALDTIEALFGAVADERVLRSELHRLFTWLKDRGITTIVTGERGHGQLTRHGLEEYVSDCVVLLDHRVVDEVSTRRLRIVKYRGSLHGTNEYPFLVDERGFSLFPVTSLVLDHPASTERIPTGVPRLDEMLGGQGYYRGSTVLVSGSAGSGKTSLAAHFVDAACARGESCLYLSFEESPQQMVRNMRSIGIDLQKWMDKGLLKFVSTRASLYGLELHLLNIHKLIDAHRPRNLVLDPVTSFDGASRTGDVQVMLTRLIDALKARQITAVLTSLTTAGHPSESSEAGVSAWIDTWLLVKEVETSGERNRALYVLKARGIAHSNQVREFRITSRGVQLIDVYLGAAGMQMGSARVVQEARDRADEAEAARKVRWERLEHERRTRTIEGQLLALQAELDFEQAAFSRTVDDQHRGDDAFRARASALATSRRAPPEPPTTPERH